MKNVQDGELRGKRETLWHGQGKLYFNERSCFEVAAGSSPVGISRLLIRAYVIADQIYQKSTQYSQASQ